MHPLQALVVEDDPAHLRLLTLLLERQGFQVAQASDGAEALLQVGETYPDVVLADLNLPLLDGLQLTNAARVVHPGLPVMVLTGHGPAEPRVCALRNLPGVAVERKPTHFSTLGQRLRELVGSSADPGLPDRTRVA